MIFPLILTTVLVIISSAENPKKSRSFFNFFRTKGPKAICTKKCGEIDPAELPAENHNQVYSWVATIEHSLYLKSVPSCQYSTGSVIGLNLVLTSSFLFSDKNVLSRRIYISSAEITGLNEKLVRKEDIWSIEKIIKKKKSLFGENVSRLTLLVIAPAINRRTFPDIVPVCVPPANFRKDEKRSVTILIRGIKNVHGPSKERYAYVPATQIVERKSKYVTKINWTANEEKQGLKDLQLAKGGPVTDKVNGRYVLVGVLDEIPGKSEIQSVYLPMDWDWLVKAANEHCICIAPQAAVAN